MNNRQNLHGEHVAVDAEKTSVALLVTCLVDLFRPAVGFAAIKLLEQAGYTVEVPEQSCCGQPNYNNGDRAGARAMALQLIDRFHAYDYVVGPSRTADLGVPPILGAHGPGRVHIVIV